MLRIFRINDPYRLLGIFIMLILISLAFFLDPVDSTLDELHSIVLGESLNKGKNLYSQLFTNTAPLASWFFGWIEFLLGRSLTARHILSFIIIFFQGAYFAILLINNKAQNESTYLPALIFGVLCFFSFDTLTLSAELLASTFLLFALNNLFKEIEFRIQRDTLVLNLGFFLGIASLLVFSYVVFLPGTLLILSVFTRITFRKAGLLILGFVLPHALLIVGYLIKGDFVFLWNNFYSGNEWFTDNQISVVSMIYLSAIPIVFFLISLVMLNREARLTKYQSQLMQVMFIWLFISVVEISVAGKMSPLRFIVFAPPFSYFISHYFLLIRRKWIGETMLLFFIGGIVVTGYLARYQKIIAIDYGNLFYEKSTYTQIKNKRVLVLGTEWGIFENNQLASYFLDWQLSRDVFAEPDYFQNIVLIDQSFEQDPPEVIVDRENLMRRIMERIPHLRQEYTRQGDLYIRIK